jgi:hypothetical protein
VRRANPSQAGHLPRAACVYGAEAPDPFGVQRSSKGLLGRVTDVFRMALGRDDARADYECAKG